MRGRGEQRSVDDRHLRGSGATVERALKKHHVVDSRSAAVVVIATLALLVASAGVALGNGYVPGFYAGRTAQGKAITFLAAGGKVSDLYTHIVDTCRRGSYTDNLFPHPALVNARGNWFHRADEMPTQPTVYHGHLDGIRASGTITDVVDPSRGRRCQGHTSFHATRSDPVRIGPATVGGDGTDVELGVRKPAASDGNQLVRSPPTALLVYGSSTGCPASYQAADALARSVDAAGFSGLISDAYVDTDYEVQPYELAYFGYQHGVFTFHVAANTVVPANGQSPFSTVCVMLYSGVPASLTPSANSALATTSAPLVLGPGIPDNQP